MSEDSQATRELTFGEKAVGLNFNPSNDPKVQEIKEVFAKLIDMVGTVEGQGLTQGIKSSAVHALIDAQMWAVKAATWKN